MVIFPVLMAGFFLPWKTTFFQGWLFLYHVTFANIARVERLFYNKLGL